MPALQREAFWAKGRLLCDLRQSVPQNGHVHLLGVDVRSRKWDDSQVGFRGSNAEIFHGVEGAALEAPKEANLKPDMQTGKQFAQSKPRRQETDELQR